MVGSCIDIFTFVLYVVVQGCLYLSIFILEEPEYNINITFEETTLKIKSDLRNCEINFYSAFPR